jgi:hypothetical protein
MKYNKRNNRDSRGIFAGMDEELFEKLKKSIGVAKEEKKFIKYTPKKKPGKKK